MLSSWCVHVRNTTSDSARTPPLDLYYHCLSHTFRMHPGYSQQQQECPSTEGALECWISEKMDLTLHYTELSSLRAMAA